MGLLRFKNWKAYQVFMKLQSKQENPLLGVACVDGPTYLDAEVKVSADDESTPPKVFS